jgi:serine/threonine protein phosphatase PrpC
VTGGTEPVATGSTEPVATGGTGGADAGGGAAARAATSACPACGEALVEGARFCEACGAATNGTSPTAGAGTGDAAGAARGADADPTLETPVVPAGGCAKCGGEVDGDGYCTSCGHRALEDVTVDDRGTVAYATHRGRRHPRNEDSAALAATGEGWPVLVVSDGVSVSPNPHKASSAAVVAAAGRLGGRSFAGDDDLAAAVADAHEAASQVSGDDDPTWTPDGTHPACTIVVALATDSAVHVANVGDARAHLLRGAGEGDGWTATQITTDDSVAAHAVAQGIDAEVALNLPGGHGITAWLGADAHGLAPHVATHPARPGDVLLVCSDGLWNYAPTDQAMSQLLTATLPPRGQPTEPLATLCERLVSWAIDQGGADNICVAMTPLPTGSTDVADPTEEDNA